VRIQIAAVGIERIVDLGQPRVSEDLVTHAAEGIRRTRKRCPPPQQKGTPKDGQRWS
jgi:hypothetical protein